MLCMMNTGNHLGAATKVKEDLSIHGPPTVPQWAALCRLTTAADFLVDKNPGPIEGDDGELRLKSRKVTYGGEEAVVTSQICLCQVAADLPPPGTAGSLEAMRFTTGSVRRFLAEPGLLRKPEEEVEMPATRPRSRIRPSEQMAVYQILWQRDSVVGIEPSKAATHKGKQVENALFGVGKPKEEKVINDEGEEMAILRLSMNLIWSKALMIFLYADIECLPIARQWTAFQLEAFYAPLHSEKDRTCFFYVLGWGECWYTYL